MSDKEIKVRGIVIREAPMGDKDKRVVLLTEEMGKISLLAKGTLGPRSKFASLTQLFALGEFVLSKGRTFYYIKEARLLESFYDLRISLERLGYATWMAEVADTLSLEGQENQGLMHLFYRALRQEVSSEEGKEQLPADIFVLRALSEGGFYPSLHACPVCGRGLLDDENEADLMPVLFDFRNGSAICRLCRLRGGFTGAVVHRGTIRAMQYIVDAPVEKVFSFTVTQEVGQELHEAVVGYLKEQTERRYLGLDFLHSL